MRTHCPDCKKFLSSKIKCRCGWTNKDLEEEPQHADHRCQYQIKGRRCPLPGTICNHPYGSGPWYCSGHWHALNDPKLGEAVLIEAEKNYQEIMESRRDWRVKHIELLSIQYH